MCRYCPERNIRVASTSYHSPTAIFRQIAEQVRMAIATGKLRMGDQLPSVRALAEDLVLNPNTVARAYTDLTRDGLIESRSGRGVFIIRKRKVFTREEGRRRLEPLLDALIGEAMAMDFTREELQDLFQKKLNHWKHEGGPS